MHNIIGPSCCAQHHWCIILCITLLMYYIVHNITVVLYCPQSHTWWSWFWTWWRWSSVTWDETFTSPPESTTNSWTGPLFLSLWAWQHRVYDDMLDAYLAIPFKFSGVSVWFPSIWFHPVRPVGLCVCVCVYGVCMCVLCVCVMCV